MAMDMDYKITLIIKQKILKTTTTTNFIENICNKIIFYFV